ncbi:uncharacterized protein LOC118742733 [Rhagoletis pomonella]|uniref:uncharacterized protein LOC118742733 n=1 Tax=Rhagoletis pomonella TaxID=28610 RepID=UPI0017819C74|nr:uncharacterized protein LOC118742733 [Rhagoletis pomonella]
MRENTARNGCKIYSLGQQCMRTRAFRRLHIRSLSTTYAPQNCRVNKLLACVCRILSVKLRLIAIRERTNNTYLCTYTHTRVQRRSGSNQLELATERASHSHRTNSPATRCRTATHGAWDCPRVCECDKGDYKRDSKL